MAEKSAKPKVVKVRRTPAGSYNPNRSIKRNPLIQHHLKNLHKVEMQLPAEARTGMDFQSIDTEAEASEYIHRMTTILHERERSKTAGGGEQALG